MKWKTYVPNNLESSELAKDHSPNNEATIDTKNTDKPDIENYEYDYIDDSRR